MGLCVCVEPRCAEKTRRILRDRGILDSARRAVREQGLVCFPVARAPDTELSGCAVSVRECGGQPVARPAAPPRGYDIIGDVVIVRENALEDIDPGLFVEAVRRVHPRIRAVYVKEGTFSEHRVSRLRLLWGTDVDYVVHKEHGIKLHVPLHEAYYNPRLASEHRRVAETVVPGERVVDLFSGIGGFSLHIASCAEALVVANDINPAAVKALINSIALNKRLLRGRIVAMMGDAADAPEVLGENRWDRVIANLPHSSLSYIDTYRRLLRPGGILHLYLVAPGLEEAYSLAAENLPENEWRVVSGRRVLEYAPYKYIYRLNLVRL